MKYIPNRTKLCKNCGRVILYNEEYMGVDTLDADNSIRTELRHSHCIPSFNADPAFSQWATQFSQGIWSGNSYSPSLRGSVSMQQQQQLASQLRSKQRDLVSLSTHRTLQMAHPPDKVPAQTDIQRYKELVKKYYKAITGGTDVKKDTEDGTSQIPN